MGAGSMITTCRPARTPATLARKSSAQTATCCCPPSTTRRHLAWLREVPAVETLRRVWVQQFYIEAGWVHWRTEAEDLPPSRLFISSPYETAAGPVADGEATPLIHQSLGDKALLPGKHIVDTGYLDAELLVRSKQDYGVALLGPTRADYKWQARAATGFDAGSFRVDWGVSRPPARKAGPA